MKKIPRDVGNHGRSSEDCLIIYVRALPGGVSNYIHSACVDYRYAQDEATVIHRVHTRTDAWKIVGTGLVLKIEMGRQQNVARKMLIPLRGTEAMAPPVLMVFSPIILNNTANNTILWFPHCSFGRGFVLRSF